MTTIMNRILMPPAIAAAIALSGCGANNHSPIDGAWKMQVGPAASYEFDFNPDSTWRVTMITSSSNGSFNLSYGGTYTLTGQTVDCLIANARVNAQSIEYPVGTSESGNAKKPGDVRYTWNLKDSRTLDLTLVSLPQGSSGLMLPNATIELTKQ